MFSFKLYFEFTDIVVYFVRFPDVSESQTNAFWRPILQTHHVEICPTVRSEHGQRLPGDSGLPSKFLLGELHVFNGSEILLLTDTKCFDGWTLRADTKNTFLILSSFLFLLF